jgi:monoamine oxidase
MLLEGSGVEVEVFEGRNRIGGRIQTVDEGGGAVYEAGGEWIDGDQHRVLDLLNGFGIEPSVRPSWPGKVIYQGKETTEDLLWSDAMEDDLRIEAAARELCRSLSSPPWRNRDLDDLDQQTLKEFLLRHTQSERGLWWVTARYRSDEGDDPDRVGLLGWLSGYMNYVDREADVMSAYHFPVGGSRVCERIAEGLRGPIHFGKVLQRLRRDGGSVVLQFQDGEARFDEVVLTLPPRCLERVVFEPALSVTKRCAIEACQMGRILKVSWQFERAWWQEEGWGGSLMTDGPLQQTWDGGHGDAPILTAYICGNQSEQWARLGDPVRAGVYELGLVSKEAPASFVRGWVHNWQTDPFSLGGFSHLGPGFVLNHMEHISAPEANIRFAGEHTALWSGFIEGALESAERVVKEMFHA